MQVTLSTPKCNLLTRIAEQLGGTRGRIADRRRTRTGPVPGLASYQRDRAYSASFTGVPLLPMRSHGGGRGWSL